MVSKSEWQTEQNAANAGRGLEKREPSSTIIDNADLSSLSINHRGLLLKS